MPKVVLISDTHTQLDKINIPDGDILLIAGDVTFKGTAPEWFLSWNLNFPQFDGGVKARETWAKIPDDTNILITHSPPFGIGDQLDEHGSEPGKHVGCPHLLSRINDLNHLKLHVFGHIHAAFGVYDGAEFMKTGTTFVNAASCTEMYKPTNPPIVIEV